MQFSNTSSLSDSGLLYTILHMKSLFPKGAKSTFVTSEKNAFLCASLYTRLWETKFWIYIIFVLLDIFGSEMRSKGSR